MGYAAGARAGGAGAAADGGAGKALPSPGEILRMNAAGGGPPPGNPAAAAAPKAAPVPPKLETKEDIMRLIAEEDHKFKAAQTNAEAANALREKKQKWHEKQKEKGGGGGEGGGDGSSGSGGGKPKGPSAKRAAVGLAAEPTADGSWMIVGKKSKKR